MIKEDVLDKLKQPGRQLSRQVIIEIQQDLKLYKNDLLSILKREADNPQDPLSRTEYNDWIYAMYILAQAREKKAFPQILKIFSRPGNFLNPLTGDIVLQNLGQILASVAHKDISPIQKMIENKSLNEYCRGAGIEAFVILCEMNELPKEDVYQYFGSLFKKLENTPIFTWTILSQSAILLFKKSFLKEVKLAFQNGFIDEIYLDIEEIESYIADPELSQLRLAKKKHGIIVDALTAMEWWANFKE